MSCHDYYKKYKDIVVTALQFGSNLGGTRKYVDQVLKDKAADPDKLTETELKHAIATAHNWFIAMGLLLHSNPKCYSEMVHDVENQFTFGNNIYPETLDEAYDYLINYKADWQFNNVDQGRLSFLAEGDAPPGRGHGQGCGSGHGDRGQGAEGSQGQPPPT